MRGIRRGFGTPRSRLLSKVHAVWFPYNEPSPSQELVGNFDSRESDLTTVYGEPVPDNWRSILARASVTSPEVCRTDADNNSAVGDIGRSHRRVQRYAAPAASSAANGILNNWAMISDSRHCRCLQCQGEFVLASRERDREHPRRSSECSWARPGPLRRERHRAADRTGEAGSA